ncbi:MAG: SRPBCC family protein [Opitutales bacterium]
MWHFLRSQLELDLPVPQVFDFFSRAENLEKITPDNLGFEILTPTPIEMTRDIEIDYRIKLSGLPMRWRTLISVWQPPHEFVDEQLKGPYHSWIHRHTFAPLEGGRTLMTDYVRYKLPFTPFGEIGIFYVKPQVETIFRHRNEKIPELLGCTATQGSFESR